MAGRLVLLLHVSADGAVESATIPSNRGLSESVGACIERQTPAPVDAGAEVAR
jgi:hypothetical protein